MKPVNFAKIEKRWQSKWAEKKAFAASEKSKKKKYYVLEMFPYPSGSGLHMGHAFNYTVGDTYARYMRMRGFNVLYPMGFDSFGLPAENAAIKEGVHPKKYMKGVIKNYVKQMKNLGLSYDWSRTLKTSSPEYYRWNQYFFLKFLEKGLIYRKKGNVNWCSQCRTVLANEQVHNGKCWRHENVEVEIKQLEQWYIHTTKYADELLKELDKLDWPERIKVMQRNWIGRSEGTEIVFDVQKKISNCIIVHGSPSKNEKSMNPETRTYDKHWIPWIKDKLIGKHIRVETPLMPEPWEPKYKDWKNEFEKLKINEDSVLVGHSAGGGFLVRWLGETKRKIKKLILVAPAIMHSGNYVPLMDLLKFEIDKSITNNVGEIVIFVSDDDSRGIRKSVDIFSKVFNVRPVEFRGKGHFTLGDMGAEEFPELLNEITAGEKWKVFTTRPDTLFGATFMVVSAQHPGLMDLATKEQKKEVEKFLKKIKTTKKEDLDKLDKEGVFTGSYALHPLTKEKIPIWAGNFVVADYGSGMVMGVPAHDDRDYDFAKKYNLPIKEVVKGGDISKKAFTDFGVLVNSEAFNGLNSAEAKEHITNSLEIKKLGCKTVQFKLRDWLVSRQRYWGTPIPVVYCDKCGIVPVPEKELPVVLPDKVKFGEGNPLATNKEFVNVKCYKCGGKARRETDTMDTFFDSSWYFLRYLDSENSKKPFELDKVKYWMPVDQYIGGAEHAVMHLIYARFFVKALRDLGFVRINEPFMKLFNQGMLHKDGSVMSKSRGNVVLPEKISEKYGIDAARLFLVSIASPDKDIEWSDSGIEGSWKFVNKIMNLIPKIKIGKTSEKMAHKINKTVKIIGEDIEGFRYNFAVIKLRALFDSLESEIGRKDLESVIKILSPFCPHIAEELWFKSGGKGFVSLSEWPEFDGNKINEKFDKVEQVVEKTVSDILNVLKIVGKSDKVYIYALPNELEFFDSAELANRVGREVKVFSVADRAKYDPSGKASKARPGKPAIYVE